MRSLAQWSRASEVWFSKSRGPKKGQTQKGELAGEQEREVSSLSGVSSHGLLHTCEVGLCLYSVNLMPCTDISG